jgi:copper(I)-binding protein
MKLLRIAGLALLLAACGHGRPEAGLRIEQAQARATPAPGVTAVAYLTITSGRDDRLLGADCDIADHVEIHQMAMDQGIMRMRALSEGLPIAAGKPLQFGPGGYHLMLINPRRALEAGEKIPLRLRFERAGEVNVELLVAPIQGS